MTPRDKSIERPEVRTSRGRVRGIRLGDRALAFRGLRYAAPPIGDRRFAPPAPLEEWGGVQDASVPGAASVQSPLSRGAIGDLYGTGELARSEDCLFLDVYTPGLDDARRPVMVWIHGGGFTIGTGAAPAHNGRYLAADDDVVVVTVNYRLGLLGFLHSPALGSTNAGLLDQVAALEWVRDEIVHFGGDPDRVTVFGQSAGAKSIECLLAMPPARGLFHRAVLQSLFNADTDPAPMASRTSVLLRELGADDVEDLRHRSLEELLAADATAIAETGKGGFGSGPVVDGVVLPAEPLDAIRRGHGQAVDVVVGTTLEESRLFGVGFGEVTETELLDALAAEFAEPAVALDAYRRTLADLGTATDLAAVQVALASDRAFRWRSNALVEGLEARGAQAWSYLFTWPSAVAGGALGACHGVEIPFVFGTQREMVGLVGEGADDLAARVRDAWCAFARNGDPGEQWPATGTEGMVAVFGEKSRVIAAPFAAVDELRTAQSAAR